MCRVIDIVLFAFSTFIAFYFVMCFIFFDAFYFFRLHIETTFGHQHYIEGEIGDDENPLFTLVKWKPFNVITFGQTDSDNIHCMITIGEYSGHMY
jgi:hypothetical protein